MTIPVIDLFAGPGGLGEGFSSYKRKDGANFKIKLSIEKDRHAHQTLKLRAFFRQFPEGQVPTDYYDYLAGKCSIQDLYRRYQIEAAKAETEAWHAELGGKETNDDEVDERISKALGACPKKWLLIGGPPCQAYSLVGRSRRKNDVKFATDEKHFLYKQYLRIIAEHRPPVFVMENVKGLLSAKVDGKKIFDRIISDLQNPLNALGETVKRRGDPLAYKLVSLVVSQKKDGSNCSPDDFLIESEHYGIPQARHRLIILGLRNDINKVPRLLRKGDLVSTKDVISDLPLVRSGLSQESDSFEVWKSALLEIEHAPWLFEEPVDDDVRAEIARQLQRVGRNLDRGSEFIQLKNQHGPVKLAYWFTDPRLHGVCNHTTRSHIREDLHRYFFVSAFGKVHKRTALLKDFPMGLLPDHKNVAAGIEHDKFNDRFRVQIANRPSTTVTSHISKDGHYFIHYDTSQCRSFTVREAARLQTFPDNYFFTGPRTQQYHQVGNAVPPLLARKIAGIVAELFD